MKRQAEVFQLWILKRRPCFKMQSIFCFDLANFRNVLGAKQVTNIRRLDNLVGISLKQNRTQIVTILSNLLLNNGCLGKVSDTEVDENKAMAVMHLTIPTWISTRFQCVKCICRSTCPAGGLLESDGSVEKVQGSITFGGPV